MSRSSSSSSKFSPKTSHKQLSPRLSRKKDDTITSTYSAGRFLVPYEEGILQIKSIHFSNPPLNDPERTHQIAIETEEGRVTLSPEESKNYFIGVEITYYIYNSGVKLSFTTNEVYAADTFDINIINAFETAKKSSKHRFEIQLKDQTDDHNIEISISYENAKSAYEMIESEGRKFLEKVQEKRPEFFE